LDEARAERDALAARDAAAGPAREAPPEPASTEAQGGAADHAAGVPEPAEAAPGAGEPAGRNANGAGNGHDAQPAAWAAALGRELTVARAASAIAEPRTASVAPAALVPGLARERRLVAQRAAAGPAAGAKPLPGAADQRRGDRAAPITALALERERSSRLQAQLDSSLAVQRELRTHIAALQRAVHQRVEAERRIETALRRVREELTAANVLAAGRHPAPTQADAAAGAQPRAAAGTAAPAVLPMAPEAAAPPVAPLAVSAVAEPAAAAAEPRDAPSPAEAPPQHAVPALPQPAAAAPLASAAAAPAPAGLDPLRLSAARERLRATVPAAAPLASLPAGTPAPWLTAALQRLSASEPDVAGRIAVGLLPAQGLAAQRPLRYDLLLAGRGRYAVDVEPGSASVVLRSAPRPRAERDLSIAGDAAGFARLLHGRRTLRRPARVRGGRRALRELRRIARAPLGLRDLGTAGIALEPALALRLVALAIDPAATQGERFAVAHAPLAGGPVDAWLRIADGAPPAVVTQPPPEPVRLTLRCTRGALLALIAGVEPAPGESGTLDGDDAALALLRSWIARTEHPAA
jgi:hypothetical protein